MMHATLIHNDAKKYMQIHPGGVYGDQKMHVTPYTMMQRGIQSTNAH